MAPRRRPRRITLDLSEDEFQRLTEARYADGVPNAVRLRALLALHDEDRRLAERTTVRARELQRQDDQTM